MKLIRRIFLPFCFVFCCYGSYAQPVKTKDLVRHLSREDLHDYLLYQSKKEKANAVGAAILGPLFSGIGLYLLNKEHATANWQDNSPSKMYGTLLTSFGVVLSVSSIPLFVSAGQTRREADLLLTAGYTTPFQRIVAAPGAGVRITF
ncbi:MAG TPA: hypothetical protein VFL47_05810 [Flavisolibacter sp.]|nr:hypothetical protein [Flavisolibacter sp.]